MKFATRHILAITCSAFILTMGACSKKEVQEDDVAAATDASMEVSDLAAGAPIPELPPVYFAYDSFSISSESRSALNAHSDWLNANPAVNVQIEGHCDERGTTEYNLALGERRANAVRDYLIGQGVSAGRMTTISYGEERPSVLGSGESVWSQNRRSEFVSAGQ